MPINSIQTNSNQIHFNREPFGFSNCRLSARPDSIASSSGNSSFFSQFISFIKRLFSCLFCCLPRQEATSETTSINVYSKVWGNMHGFFAEIGNLPKIKEIIRVNFEQAGDPASLNRLRLLDIPLTKMIENADQLSFIFIKESHISENGRYHFYKIEVSNKGKPCDPLEIISQEDRDAINAFWTIAYERDESNHTNNIILEMKSTVLEERN